MSFIAVALPVTVALVTPPELFHAYAYFNAFACDDYEVSLPHCTTALPLRPCRRCLEGYQPGD